MLSNILAKRMIGMFVGPTLLLLFAWSHRADGAATATTGQKVYLQQCASCHGAKGEGGKAYPKPLTGTRSTGELARFIAQTMPPGPRKCPASEAKQVATFIYDAFYSPLAQERNRPARVALSRLTVRQFRNAVADLIRSFHSPVALDARHGLRGEYFKSRDFEDKERVLDRIDPTVSFDFGTAGPTQEQFDPHHFSIRWQGSVLAPDTGEYEFIVRTEHATQLYVNGEKQPLIDAWVNEGLTHGSNRGKTTSITALFCSSAVVPILSASNSPNLRRG